MIPNRKKYAIESTELSFWMECSRVAMTSCVSVRVLCSSKAKWVAEESYKDKF